jgi:hypothetical protein
LRERLNRLQELHILPEHRGSARGKLGRPGRDVEPGMIEDRRVNLLKRRR